MAKNSGLNIELTAFDDLFETDESRAENKREKLLEIPLEQISDLSFRLALHEIQQL